MGQAVAGRVDRVDERRELVALPAHHVQDRSEHLAREVSETAEVPQVHDRRRDERAARAFGRQRHLDDAKARRAHPLDVRDERRARLGVDHRADVGGEPPRVAHRELGERAFEHRQHLRRDVVLQAQDAQRRAALAGAVERRGQRIRDHLLGQRRAVDDHRVLAAGLGDQHRVVVAGRELAVDEARDLGGAGEDDARDTRIRDQRRADRLAAPGQQLQRRRRHAGAMQDAHRCIGDQRRLLGGLREHGIAGGERRADFAGEDREREVPRRNRDDRAERRDARRAQLGARLRRVVAQEIDRLAHFGHRVRERLARFAHGEREQRRAFGFHEIGGALEAGRALGRGRGRPRRSALDRDRHGRRDVGDRRFDHGADHVVAVRRIADFDGRSSGVGFNCGVRRGNRARRFVAPSNLTPFRCRLGPQRSVPSRERVERGELPVVGKVGTPRIAAARQQRDRQRDAGMRPAAACLGEGDRVDDQRCDGDRRVDDPVDERAVRAVLEQPPHQVGEQRLVRADRRVDAAGAIELRLPHDLVVDALAHAVQALEFVLRIAGELVHRGDGERIVARELRIDRVGRRQHRLRAGEVRDVGVHLAREHRVARQAVDLGALDLGVPVGALDEAQHQAPPVLPRKRDDPVDRGPRPLLVALHDETEAVPVRERRVGREPGDDVERQVEAVGLLGVDRETDVVVLRQPGQRQELRRQLRHHALALRTAKARVQRRQLHRYAGSGHHTPAVGRAADRVDRGFVRDEVALGVGRRHRRLAQHVVRERVAARLAVAGIGERFVDRAPGDELAAQQPHREIDALADQRLAALAQQRGQRLLERAFAARFDDLPGDQQTPRRRVHEQRRRRPDVRRPVAAADLVADQPVARGGIRDAQQRLGEAHQRDALAAVQRELEHQRVDAAGVRARRANRLGQRRRHRLRPGERRRREAGLADQRRQRFALVGPMARSDALAQRSEGIGLARAFEAEIEGCAGGGVHERLPITAGGTMRSGTSGGF